MTHFKNECSENTMATSGLTTGHKKCTCCVPTIPPTDPDAPKPTFSSKPTITTTTISTTNPFGVVDNFSNRNELLAAQTYRFADNYQILASFYAVIELPRLNSTSLIWAEDDILGYLKGFVSLEQLFVQTTSDLTDF